MQDPFSFFTHTHTHTQLCWRTKAIIYNLKMRKPRIKEYGSYLILPFKQHILWKKKKIHLKPSVLVQHSAFPGMSDAFKYKE